MHAHGGELQLIGGVDVRVRDVDAAVKDIRSSEDDILRPNLITLFGIFPPVEPGEVHHLPAAVGKMSDHPFLAGTHLERLETEDMSLHLYERHVACEFPDVIETAAVHMLIGIILQQVTKSLDAQLVVEHLLPVRTYAWQVLYVLLQYIRHPIKTSAIFRS